MYFKNILHTFKEIQMMSGFLEFLYKAEMVRFCSYAIYSTLTQTLINSSYF